MVPLIIGAAIAAGTSIAGGIMSYHGAMASRSAIRRAARKNYNTQMKNARMMERSVYENMTSYQRDAAEYRDTMFQRTMANGGIRADAANMSGLDEVKDYNFDIEKIDTNRYTDDGTKKYYRTVADRDSGGVKLEQRNPNEHEIATQGAKIDDKNNDYLYNALVNYEGKKAKFADPNQNSALGVMRESVSELQTDLNRTYVQGMTEVLQQRQSAQNAWQSQQTQSELYKIQGMQSLWSGLLGAGQATSNAFMSYYAKKG